MGEAARKLPEEDFIQPQPTSNQANNPQPGNIVNFEDYRREREFFRQLKQAKQNSKNRTEEQQKPNRLAQAEKAVGQGAQIARQSSVKNELAKSLSGATEKMGPRLEKTTANILRQAKEEAKAKTSESDQKFLKELKTSAGRLEELAQIPNGYLKTIQSYYEGIRLAYILRTDIAKDNFDGITFIFVLTISIFKDFVIDVPSVATETATVGLAAIITTSIKAVIGFAISGFLFFFYFGRSSWTKRWLLKRLLGTIVIEIAPWLSLIPSYTLMAIFLKLKIDKKNAERQKKLEEVEKRNKKLKQQLDRVK